MSAFGALRGIPGTVTRRSPGGLRYVIPPILALVLVAGFRVFETTTPVSPVVDGPISDQPPVVVDLPAGDLLPRTEVAPIGGVDVADTDRRIAFWQERLRTTPRSEQAWIYLGDLLDLKGRQTGDVGQFVAANDAYQAAISIAPRSSDAHAGAARMMITLHDFAGALAEATTTLEIDSSSDGALAVLFDASIELGDMDNAEQALELLTQRVTDPSITVRQARLAYVRGDTATAAALAVEAATDSAGQGDPPASVALFEFTAGEYSMLAGDPDSADSHYGAALRALPGYPLAVAGQGRAAFAHGDLEAAIGHYESAIAALPRPDLLAFLGDLHALTGNTAAAEEQYETVEFIASMATDGGRVYDREYALFLADHGRDTATSLRLAQAEIEQRQDVFAYDTLAWALHAVGREADALDAAHQALAFGTVDARLLVHAGLIELANGLDEEGTAHLEQAMALRPAFSPLVLQAAREALGE